MSTPAQFVDKMAVLYDDGGDEPGDILFVGDRTQCLNFMRNRNIPTDLCYCKVNVADPKQVEIGRRSSYVL